MARPLEEGRVRHQDIGEICGQASRVPTCSRRQHVGFDYLNTVRETVRTNVFSRQFRDRIVAFDQHNAAGRIQARIGETDGTGARSEVADHIVRPRLEQAGQQHRVGPRAMCATRRLAQAQTAAEPEVRLSGLRHREVPQRAPHR